MSKGKHAAPRRERHSRAGRLRLSPRSCIVLILALTLCFGGVVGGTVAWLATASAPVVNTFTYGDINIGLTETDTGLDNDNNPYTNDYKMMPEQQITKDPTVTVVAGSEPMWLFVKLDKSANFDSFMTYAMAEGWTELTGKAGVYYRMIDAATAAAGASYGVIANNTVTVKGDVTKEMLNALDAGGAANYPTLTVTAYAVQYLGNESAAAAWSRIGIS